MKLKIGDKVYLQKYEVAYIMHSLNKLPQSIVQETFNSEGFFFMKGPADGLRFECVYEDPNNVRWLMEQDWIIDFNEYVEAPLGELEALQECLKAEYSTGIKRFNAKNKTYREVFFDEESEKFDRLKHKIVSLGYLIELHKGTITFAFPDGYHDKTSIFQKKLSFFARLFNHSTQ